MSIPKDAISVLDKGYVQLIDCMGNDLSIIDAARVSYLKESSQFSKERNQALLKYLLELKLLQLFGGNGFVIEWQNIMLNQDDILNIKRMSFICQKSFVNKIKKNKQASVETEELPHELLRVALIAHYNQSFELYQKMLNMGVAKELARLALPGWACYHEFIVKMNLHSLLNFIKKRNTLDAQYEIRKYATVLEQFVNVVCPWTYRFAKELSVI